MVWISCLIGVLKEKEEDRKRPFEELKIFFEEKGGVEKEGVSG